MSSKGKGKGSGGVKTRSKTTSPDRVSSSGSPKHGGGLSPSYAEMAAIYTSYSGPSLVTGNHHKRQHPNPHQKCYFGFPSICNKNTGYLVYGNEEIGSRS